MTPEWEELKDYIERTALSGSAHYTTAKNIRNKMTEIESRMLPQRVAEILRNINPDVLWSWGLANGGKLGQPVYISAFPAIAHALETGDTSEIEKWRKRGLNT